MHRSVRRAHARAAVVVVAALAAGALTPAGLGVARAAGPVQVSTTRAWQGQFGTAGTDVAIGVAVDATSVAVVGYTDGTFLSQSAAGGHDAFVRSIDRTTGVARWTRQFGGPGTDEAWAVATDATGDVFVAGLTQSPLSGQTGLGGADAFLRKYNPAGVEVWTRQFGTAGDDAAYGVAVDRAGNVYVAGGTWGALAGQAPAGSEDAFVRKYDPTGVEVWTRQFGTAGVDSASSVSVDPGGAVFVGGVASGSLAGQAWSGGQDAFVARLDGAGNLVWTRQFGTAADDSAGGVAADGGGGVAVAGVWGRVGTDPNSGDAFVRRYDPGGALVWARQYGTPAADEARGVAVDGLGDVYASGYTNGTQAQVVEFSPTGAQVWSAGPPSGGISSAVGVTVDDVGDVYPTGFTTGVLPGQTSTGGADAWVQRIMIDSDRDCLSDYEERRYYGTDPNNPDTAGTGLGDAVAADLADVQRLNPPPPQRLGCVYLSSAGAERAAQQALAQANQVVASTLATIDQVIAQAGQVVGPVVGQVRQQVDQLVAQAQGALAQLVAAAGQAAGQVQALAGELRAQVEARVARLLSPQEWTDQYGPAGDAGMFGAALDGAGNLYVVGYQSTPSPAGPQPGAHDVVLRAYDPRGRVRFTRSLGAGGSNVGYGVAVDGAGRVVVAGRAGGSLFGPWLGGEDAFVAQFDGSGNLLWRDQFGTAADDEAWSVAVGPGGAVAVAGLTRGALPGQTWSGAADGFVRVYDAAGTVRWTRQFGTAADDAAWSVAMDGAGNVYAAGSTWGALSAPSSGGAEDAFLRRYDATGTLVWSLQWGGAGRDAALGVAVDPAGNPYVTGMQDGSAAPGFPSGTDAFLRKYSPGGALTWGRVFGTAGTDIAHGVAVDAAGAAYVGGMWGATATTPGQAFTRKYASGGVLWWDHVVAAQPRTPFSPPATAVAQGVGLDPSGELYAVGYTDGNLDGQVRDPNTPRTIAGWVARQFVDSDRDCVSDAEEARYGTDPTNPATRGVPDAVVATAADAAATQPPPLHRVTCLAGLPPAPRTAG